VASSWVTLATRVPSVALAALRADPERSLEAELVAAMGG